jgi:hypothetical protein
LSDSTKPYLKDISETFNIYTIITYFICF